MSLLDLIREAEAKLRQSEPGYERDEGNEESAARAPANPSHEFRDVAGALPFLAMPLDEFATRGALLEIRVPWLPVTLWLVPAERDVAPLVAEGVTRGRIWTARELLAVMSITDKTSEATKTLARAKLAVDGDIVDVRRR